MDMVISWSGSQSQEMARFLRNDWLLKVLPGAKPWMSEMDIEKGSLWSPELLGKLANTGVCIICVTPQNLQRPWIFFEAGMILSNIAKARVHPYLMGVTNGHLAGSPLSLVQMTEATRTDTRRMLRDLNLQLGLGLDPQDLDTAFKAHWPRLQAKIKKTIVAEPEPPAMPTRPTREPLSEGAINFLLCHTQENQTGAFDPDTFFGTPRVIAQNRRYVEELRDHELLDLDPDGLRVNVDGYALADKLRAEGREAVSDEEHDDADLTNILYDWFMSQEDKTRLIRFAQVDAQTNLPAGTAKRLLEKSAARNGYVASSEGAGPNTIFFTKFTQLPTVIGPPRGGWREKARGFLPSDD